MARANMSGNKWSFLRAVSPNESSKWARQAREEVLVIGKNSFPPVPPYDNAHISNCFGSPALLHNNSYNALQDRKVAKE